jgi:hypothetical protein
MNMKRNSSQPNIAAPEIRVKKPINLKIIPPSMDDTSSNLDQIVEETKIPLI